MSSPPESPSAVQATAAAAPPGDGPRPTALHALHRELGARLVPFAGYDMPVQYPAGILKEHAQVRTAAGLFDVSHMGQIRLTGDGADRALERIVPGDIQGLAPGRMRYTLFTGEAGGILDDLMVTRRPGHLFLVVNAGRKHADLAHLAAHLDPGIGVEYLGERGLLALQGPAAAAVLARLVPEAATARFMSGFDAEIEGVPVFVTRSGYTGEDGFEISVPEEAADGVARRLLAEPEVMPIGLGARDSLRLEAGLCLHGHDIDETTTPVEADLGFALSKRRREEGGFLGAPAILAQLREGAPRRRVGLRLDGRQPAREGAEIATPEGRAVGRVTSGGFGPTVGAAIALGYVETALAQPGTPLHLLVRGQTLPARTVPLPFVPHRYHRG